MAGKILLFNNSLLRFGQNNEGEYGDSLSIQKIDKLTTNDYSEKHMGLLKIDRYKGPHTLNFNTKTNQVIFDYYTNNFSFFAGIRRLLGWLNR